MEPLFDKIINHLYKVDTLQKIIYVSIGCKLKSFQIPSSFDFIFNRFYNTSISYHIILIDQHIESTPYIINYMNNIIYPNNFININDIVGISNENINIYMENTYNTYVYVIKNYVTYYGYKQEDDREYINIMSFLYNINYITIKQKLLFIFNDFTKGNNTDILIQYFINDYKYNSDSLNFNEHIDHIIYGCDYKILYIFSNNTISIFNPYFILKIIYHYSIFHSMK